MPLPPGSNPSASGSSPCGLAPSLLEPGRVPRRTACAPAAAFLLAASAAAAAGAEPDFTLPDRSARVVLHDMDVRLDPSSHEVSGIQRVSWRNDSREAVSSLWWHLYLNAFLNDQSTMAIEQRRDGEEPDGELSRREDWWGWCRITAMTTASGHDLAATLEYRSPDDGNPHDRTVARVELPTPIPPGGSVTVLVQFTSRLPRARQRTGHAGDYHFVAQWFPKLGVFEGRAAQPGTEGWNCHQYHANAEFFADHGTYLVRITVPGEYGGAAGGRIGATGTLVGTEGPAADGSWTYRYAAEDVHDFAWAADPDFVVLHRTWRQAAQRDARVAAEERFLRDRVGVPAELLVMPDVRVRLLLQPEHAGQAERHFRAAFEALTWYGLWCGAYPYPGLTIVDPQHGAGDTGGMEYPTLFTAGTTWRAPERDTWNGPEAVVVHEVGHQHFHGLVATDEAAAAWLDEGLNSWAEDHVMDRGWGGVVRHRGIGGLLVARRPLLPLSEGEGPRGWLRLHGFGLAPDGLPRLLAEHVGMTWVPGPRYVGPMANRRRLAEHGTKDAVITPAFRTYDGDSYVTIAYSKPALVMAQLERVHGREKVLRAVRAWCARYRFAHPGSEDFLAVLEEVAGIPSDGVRRLLAPEILDYAVGEVTSERARPPRGFVAGDGDPAFVRPEEADGDEGSSWLSIVKLRRIGTQVAPVEVSVTFEGAPAPEVHEWDGVASWHALRFERPGKVVRVEVDPALELVLDVNRLDNSWTDRPDALPAMTWAARVLAQVQAVLLSTRALS